MVEGALISWPVISKKGIFFWFLRSLVKVRWTFFLAGVVLGLRIPSLMGFSIWMGVVFVAILLHECGHALAARYYRQTPEIELHALGGVTRWTWVDELKWQERVIISLAGPAAGFLLAGSILVVERYWPIARSFPLALARYQFLWATLAWGAFNLLPLLPLDGGQALSEFLEHRLGHQRGRRLALQVSFVTGSAGFVVGGYAHETWVALLCGILAYDSYQRMHGVPGIRFYT